MGRAAGEIPGALFRFHCQANGTGDNDHLRSLHIGRIVAVINCMRLFWGMSRGSSNRPSSISSSSNGSNRMNIRKKDIVGCNIVMTLTMAADTQRMPCQVTAR